MYHLWLKDKADMLQMDGPPGCCDRYSIDDVADMSDALEEWEAAERRLASRQRPPAED